MSVSLPITIRPFVPDDYEWVVEIHNLLFPTDRDTVEEMRDEDAKRNPKCLHARYVAMDDAGVTVAFGGYGQSPWQFHPRKFGISVNVHPDYQNRGVGVRLYEHLRADVERYEPILLRDHVQEDKPAALAFAAKYGFQEVAREWESVLNPADFDFAPYNGVGERLAELGIVMKTLRELEPDPDRDRRLYDLDMEISLDMPNTEESTVPDFATWKKDTFEGYGLLPDGYFVAVDTATDSKYVGLTSLWSNLSDAELSTGATGTLPSYRRRGIALALKIRALRFAKESGTPLVRTWNAQSNRAMLAINEKLGFAKEPAWIEYHHQVRPEPVTIREATPRDYEAIAAVLSAVWHEFPVTADELRYQSKSRNPTMRHDRFVIEVEGKMVAVGSYGQSMSFYDPRKFHLHLDVLPEYQGRGYGKAMYEHILAALRPFAPRILTVDTLSDRERAVRFLADRGFEIAQREQTSRCDPSCFDPALYTSDMAKVMARGITLHTLAELRDADPNFYVKYESLHWELTRDVPHAEEITRLPMEEFMKRLDSPRFLSDGNFVAVDAATGEHVGLTMLWGSAANRDLHTGMTGVITPYRKCGIATALKVLALTYAKERGATAVWTTNEVGNVGMLGINARFGFEKQPDELQYTKRIPETHD